MKKRINPTRSEGLDGDVWERVLADVRGHIWEHGDFAKLAVAANLSATTVSKLAYGETSSPHMRTVIRIMDALGKSEPVLEAFKSQKPVSLQRATGWKSTRAKLKAKRTAKMHPHRVAKARTLARRGATMH